VSGGRRQIQLQRHIGEWTAAWVHPTLEQDNQARHGLKWPAAYGVCWESQPGHEQHTVLVIVLVSLWWSCQAGTYSAGSCSRAHYGWHCAEGPKCRHHSLKCTPPHDTMPPTYCHRACCNQCCHHRPAGLPALCLFMTRKVLIQRPCRVLQDAAREGECGEELGAGHWEAAGDGEAGAGDAGAGALGGDGALLRAPHQGTAGTMLCWNGCPCPCCQ
jgi:hypothetical protein